jgi:plastocyanin
VKKRSPVTVFVVPMILAVGLLVGLSSDITAQQPPTAEVKIDNFSFAPATLTVAVGTTVTWSNREDVPHQVDSPNKVFKSKVLNKDEKFSYTFSKAGSYPYVCSIHPQMTGTIVVH